MATTIIMPKAEMAMEDGLLARWRVRPGESVTKGQPVAEIETDKSILEIEAEADGVLLDAVVPEGARVPVTTVLGWIGAPGEAVPAAAASAAGRACAHGGAAADTAVGSPATPTGHATPPARSPAAAPTPPGRVPATPAAKRLAREMQVPLAAVFDSATGRPVKAADILAHGAAGHADPVAQALAGHALPAEPSDTSLPLTHIQRSSARRLVEAHLRVPAVTLQAQADVTAAAARRATLAGVAGLRVTYNDLVLKAVAAALRDCPELNVVFQGDRILRRGRVHLSMAVATDRGLLVPVIRDADRLSLANLAAEARRLADSARAGALKPADQEGGTFTVSNVGKYGITAFTPLLNLPQAAILGVCAVTERLTLRDGRLETRLELGLSLTFDHRAMDGVPPARFMERLCAELQDPDRLAAAPTDTQRTP